jgi:hypothetical protein
VLEAPHRAIKHRQHPVAVERLLGRFAVGDRGCDVVEVNPPQVAATLVRMLAGQLVGEEVVQRAEQVGAESPALRVGFLVPAVLDEAGEEFLGEVVGVGRRITAAAQVGEHRPTVGRADLRQRGAPLVRATAAFKDHTPMGGVEVGQGEAPGVASGVPRHLASRCALDTNVGRQPATAIAAAVECRGG